MGDNLKEITVKTSFGTLVACAGGDDQFPEILVFLRNENGNELMLCAVTDQSISGVEDVLRIAVYGDTKSEDYNQKVTIAREDVTDKDAWWE